jgi:hypothetical protein
MVNEPIKGKMKIPDVIRNLINTGTLAHLAKLNHDGSPQVIIVWIG